MRQFWYNLGPGDKPKAGSPNCPLEYVSRFAPFPFLASVRGVSEGVSTAYSRWNNSQRKENPNRQPTEVHMPNALICR